MEKYQTRPRYKYNILYRLGDNYSIAIATDDLDTLKKRNEYLNSLKIKDTQVIMLGGLDYYAEYQPVRTMKIEEAIKFLKEDGRL